MKPEQIAPMALTIQPGTILEDQVEKGEFLQATPLQILEEERYLLEDVTFDTVYWGDHGNNIVPQKGRLPASREQFLGKDRSRHCQSSGYATGATPDITMVGERTDFSCTGTCKRGGRWRGVRLSCSHNIGIWRHPS